MKLYSVDGNSQKLDGGSMFGNCPRAVWERWCPADDQHRIDLNCRCLLVVDDQGRKILFETGIGAFFEPKFKSRFGVVEDEHMLLKNLAALGFQPSDIDIIVLSHLHFDHAGGLLMPHEPNKPLRLAFPQAKVVVGKEAWERSLAPHPRDRASFIPELMPLLDKPGQLEQVDGDTSEFLGDGFRFHFSDGHTPGLMLAEIDSPRGPVIFMGDLVPGTAWVHLPITMGYDRFPEKVIDEKAALLPQMVERKAWAFFTHDHRVAAAQITQDAQGKFVAHEPLETMMWE